MTYLSAFSEHTTYIHTSILKAATIVHTKLPTYTEPGNSIKDPGELHPRKRTRRARGPDPGFPATSSEYQTPRVRRVHLAGSITRRLTRHKQLCPTPRSRQRRRFWRRTSRRSSHAPYDAPPFILFLLSSHTFVLANKLLFINSLSSPPFPPSSSPQENTTSPPKAPILCHFFLPERC